MFGSQALDTAIGLVLMFFIIATATSAIVEIVNQMFRKRAKDLETAIGVMLTGNASADKGPGSVVSIFKDTTVWNTASTLSKSTRSFLKGVGPSYLSAKAFADAVVEMITDSADGAILTNMPTVQKRLKTMIAEGKGTVLDIKGGLESWFDESMSRLEGRFKRWSSLFVFLVGLFLSIVINAPATTVAQNLWIDPVTRAAVVDGASSVLNSGGSVTGLESIAKTTDTMKELSLPVGWHPGDWGRFWDGIANWPGAWPVVFGWILTAIFVMLGAPFWYDLLTKLVPLRMNGSKPEAAAKDSASATKAITDAQASGAAPPAASDADTVFITRIRNSPDGQNPRANQQVQAKRLSRGESSRQDFKFSVPEASK